MTDVTRKLQGDWVLITRVLRNDRSENKTFTVRCYYGMPEITPLQIGSDRVMTLNPGEEKMLEFVWDT